MIDPISRLIHRRSGQHGPVILMYHSVISGVRTPAWPWAVSLRHFRNHLDFLVAEDWATATVSELSAAAGTCPQRTVAITFDDGYADNLRAWEELQKRGMRATWFIVTGSIGKAPAWPDDGRPGGPLLTATELCAMAASGMEIGSHTISHARLTKTDNSRLSTELSVSKTALQEVLGAEVSSFAYPYGDFDDRCVDAVRRAGYRVACTTRTGWALLDGDPLRLRRLTVFNSDTAGSLARKLCFGCNDASWGIVARYAMRRAIA